MTTKVENIAEQVRALPQREREEFLSWLADFELEHSDDWDSEIARDAQPGGRLEQVLKRVRRDIAAGRTRPLDEILDNSCPLPPRGACNPLRSRVQRERPKGVAEYSPR